jgi:hypothetical protein
MGMIRTLLVLVTMMAGCGSGVSYDRCDEYVEPPYRPPGDGRECLDDADCPTMQFCWLPGVAICGFCPDPTYECTTDDDCTDGVCVEEPPPCPGCPGPSRVCRPPCTSDSCMTSTTCDLGTGHCVPDPCPDAYACPVNQRCVGDGGDDHGCAVLGCTDHDDCDCGVCASGSCYTGPGVCSGPVA